MDQGTFVDLVQLVVLNGLSNELAQTWESPPGRLRSAERSQRSEWVRSMSAADRKLLEAFGAEAARAAVFGVLTVLDGNRKIEASSKGHLELRYISEDQSELLASSDPEAPFLPLHELLP